MEDDYEPTVIWAEQEEQLRTSRGQSVSNFYLFGLSFAVLAVCVIVLYFWNRSSGSSGPSALELVQDPDNRLIEEFTQSELYDEGEGAE